MCTKKEGKQMNKVRVVTKGFIVTAKEKPGYLKTVLLQFSPNKYSLTQDITKATIFESECSAESDIIQYNKTHKNELSFVVHAVVAETNYSFEDDESSN